MLSETSSKRDTFLATGAYIDFLSNSRILNNNTSILFPIPKRADRSILRWISIHVLYIALDFSKTGKVLGGGVIRLVIFMKIQLGHEYKDIISIDNLLSAWQEFLRGKKNKKDVQEFQFRLMDNILSLHADLSNHKYKHGSYQRFSISDPKPRIIHKATVRDRLLHHAVYRKLYPFFDKIFVPDSFSCRLNKGTHKAINRFREFAFIISKNNTRTCWILKCDVRKFFASIDQAVLMQILDKRIPDKNIVNLLNEIIGSFNSGKKGIGLPLGNLTSQLFANVYMNQFDQFVKHEVKARYYIRYADDVVIFSQDKMYLKNLIPVVNTFLKDKLKLTLHPDKIYLKTLASGVDFLGWIHFPDHRILRTKTKHRMLRRLEYTQTSEVMESYLGLLKHGNTQKIKEELLGL